MTATKKQKVKISPGTLRKLREIDAVFRELEKDKSLPTFVDFFALCMLMGIEECVNLKQMYPAVHKKLSCACGV